MNTTDGCCVSERVVQFSRDLSSVIASSGDVVAARAVASAIMETQADAAPRDLTLAVVVLTAACLQVHARAVFEVGLREVADFLRQILTEEPPARQLAASSMQFAQFAAAELRDLPAADRLSLLRYLVSLTESAAQYAWG